MIISLVLFCQHPIPARQADHFSAVLPETILLPIRSFLELSSTQLHAADTAQPWLFRSRSVPFSKHFHWLMYTPAVSSLMEYVHFHSTFTHAVCRRRLHAASNSSGTLCHENLKCMGMVCMHVSCWLCTTTACLLQPTHNAAVEGSGCLCRRFRHRHQRRASAHQEAERALQLDA